MTIAARSPYLNRFIGYVRFFEPGDWEGSEVTLRTNDGSMHCANINLLPFYDAEKRIPRGLANELP